MSPLEVMGAVLTFLYSVLAQFPMQSVAPPRDIQQPAGNQQSAGNQQPVSNDPIGMTRQTARKFSSIYDALLDEMTSQQQQPDYQRAEQTRESMSSYAKGVTQQYGDFADKMTNLFEQITGGRGDQTEPAPK